MKTFTAIAAATLLTLGAGQALAQDDGPLKASVSYADLDLSRASGRAALENRIERAIDRVCPARPLPTELRKQGSYRTCRAQAWSGARQQLAAIYDGRHLARASVEVAGLGN